MYAPALPSRVRRRSRSHRPRRNRCSGRAAASVLSSLVPPLLLPLPCHCSFGSEIGQLLLRLDIVQSGRSRDPPNGGSRGMSRGDAKEWRVSGRAADTAEKNGRTVPTSASTSKSPRLAPGQVPPATGAVAHPQPPAPWLSPRRYKSYSLDV